MNHPNLTPFHPLQAHMSTPVAAINNPRIYVTVVMAVREAMCGAGIAGHAGFAEDVLRGIAGSRRISSQVTARAMLLRADRLLAPRQMHGTGAARRVRGDIVCGRGGDRRARRH